MEKTRPIGRQAAWLILGHPSLCDSGADHRKLKKVIGNVEHWSFRDDGRKFCEEEAENDPDMKKLLEAELDSMKPEPRESP